MFLVKTNVDQTEEANCKDAYQSRDWGNKENSGAFHDEDNAGFVYKDSTSPILNLPHP